MRESPGLSTPIEQRFESAMRDLTELYEVATRFRRLVDTAERAFSDGLRVGDGVRRAVRQGHHTRPSEADCEAIEAAIVRLQTSARELDRAPEVAELRQAIERRDADRIGRLACAVFAGLDLAHPGPEAGFLAVSLRERGKRGEGIVHHAHLASRLANEIARGLASSAASPEVEERWATLARLPEPIVLSPTFEGAGSDVALRVDLRSLDLPVLRHEQTGDLWIFAERLAGPFSVALARTADDEWWAASPVPYAAYADALVQALTERSIAVTRL